MADVDMSPSAVSDRLRRVAELRPRRATAQMSPRAITARLKRVSELRDLCRKLGALSVSE